MVQNGGKVQDGVCTYVRGNFVWWKKKEILLWRISIKRIYALKVKSQKKWETMDIAYNWKSFKKPLNKSLFTEDCDILHYMWVNATEIVVSLFHSFLKFLYESNFIRFRNKLNFVYVLKVFFFLNFYPNIEKSYFFKFFKLSESWYFIM